MVQPVLLNYSTRGPENAPDIVILHGLFGDLNNWKSQAIRLAGDFRVHSLDLRNHGASPHISGMSYPEMAADVAFTCNHLQIETTHVIGHSMGGKTAMQLALSTGLEGNSLVDKLIVVDIGPRQYPHHHQEIIIGLNALHDTNLNSRKEAENLLLQYVSNSGIRSFLLKNLSRQDNGTYKLRINISEINNRYDDIAAAITDTNTAFNRPTLFIKGAESEYLTEADRPVIAKLFSTPSLKTIDGAGHWPHSEKPEVVYKVISDFLAAG